MYFVFREIGLIIYGRDVEVFARLLCSVGRVSDKRISSRSGNGSSEDN